MSKRIVGYFALPLLLLLAIAPRDGWALTPPEGFAPGPDVIMGNLPTLFQAGSNGTQVGLMMGTDICNNGDVPVNWFRLPETDHPVIPQNLYRMSGGANNDDRFEQIGQSWAMHQFFPLQNNACGFGCTSSPDSAHLGVGCSTADSASINASQTQVGSRAWINPFTGIFPATSNTHTGHTHDGTAHRILVEGNDLNPAMNPGATYYGEAQLVTAHEYAWCQSHPGQCNMFNNVSYRQFTVAGTTSFTFSPVGATVRMSPAIFAWPGATIQTIEPAPGVDGRAYIAYKVTCQGGLPTTCDYEYAIYNENLDRGIRSFSVPGGCGFGTPTNLEFHAPLNPPGIANDGTAGDAGYSNAPWTPSTGPDLASWSTETFAQNPNANALRWGTLYNFRFRAGTGPTTVNATIGFYKTGAPIIVPVLGSSNECQPSPSPTPIIDPPTPTPTATATASATGTPAPTPTATATATPDPCNSVVFREHFDGVTAPALPVSWVASFTPGAANCTTGGTCASGSNWATSPTNANTFPNSVFHDAPGCVTDSTLDSPSFYDYSRNQFLTFWHQYDLESGFDGAVLEISINGGPFIDFVAAGGEFQSGGYNGTIASGTLSPIAGRPAWTGNSGGYIRTDARMPAPLSGTLSVVLRFRLATDCTGAGTGWRVDAIDSVYYSVSCTSPTPFPSPPGTPTPRPTITPNPCFMTFFTEHFDGVTSPALPSDFSTSFAPGPANCTPTGTCTLGTNWATSNANPFSSPNCAFHDAPGCVTDSNLDTPSFLYNGPTGVFSGAWLGFFHAYDLQEGFDGAVLEISINGGPFTDIIAAGGHFLNGGYNGTIASGTLSPLAGRQAWTGSSGGYLSTRVSMPFAAVDQQVRLRFRLATDCAGASAGWRIDSIDVTFIVPCQSPTPTPTPPPTQALNLSTRMRVQPADLAGIGGFIITGSYPKQVLIRAIGPSLTGLGVPGALADPVLELHGPGTFAAITNNNWRDGQHPQLIQAIGLAPTNDLESAILTDLSSGLYTAVVRGVGNTSGVALVEVYDLSPALNNRLANISSRAFVSTGDNIVIAGFVLGGNTNNDRIIVRGLGPSIAVFGIPNFLADPTLELRDHNGALLLANNDWRDNPDQAGEISAAGLAPSSDRESALAATLPPGAYTALLAGRNNGTGIGLVEVYDLGQP